MSVIHLMSYFLYVPVIFTGTGHWPALRFEPTLSARAGKLITLLPLTRLHFFHSMCGWGTTLQAGRSRVLFRMVSLEFFIDIILPAALWL